MSLTMGEKVHWLSHKHIDVYTKDLIKQLRENNVQLVPCRWTSESQGEWATREQVKPMRLRLRTMASLVRTPTQELLFRFVLKLDPWNSPSSYDTNPHTSYASVTTFFLWHSFIGNFLSIFVIPHIQVTDELTMILKQHYARAIMHLSQANNAMQSALSQAKNALQLDMFKFSDQVLTSISTRCVCCCARGFTDCPSSGVQVFCHFYLINELFSPIWFILSFPISQCTAAGSGKTVRFNTPAGQRIRGQRLDMSDCEGLFTSFDPSSLTNSNITSPICNHCFQQHHLLLSLDHHGNGCQITTTAHLPRRSPLQHQPLFWTISSPVWCPLVICMPIYQPIQMCFWPMSEQPT